MRCFRNEGIVKSTHQWCLITSFSVSMRLLWTLHFWHWKHWWLLQLKTHTGWWIFSFIREPSKQAFSRHDLHISFLLNFRFSWSGKVGSVSPEVPTRVYECRQRVSLLCSIQGLVFRGCPEAWIWQWNKGCTGRVNPRYVEYNFCGKTTFHAVWIGLPCIFGQLFLVWIKTYFLNGSTTVPN